MKKWRSFSFACAKIHELPISVFLLSFSVSPLSVSPVFPVSLSQISGMCVFIVTRRTLAIGLPQNGRFLVYPSRVFPPRDVLSSLSPLG